MDDRRGLERGADGLGRPLDLDGAGDDAPGAADLVPLRGKRVVLPRRGDVEIGPKMDGIRLDASPPRMSLQPRLLRA